MHRIPEAIKTMIVVDYSKIGPEIFQPIKDWYHRKLDTQGIGFEADLAPDDQLYLR
ncbi:hypothetical protein D3C86_1992950 [compost metagenome]